jgi:hypothetical protein
LTWSPITHAEVEKMVEGDVVRIPRAVYTLDVISRLVAVEHQPIEVEWDPWELRELASAVLSVADGALRLAPEDSPLALDAACFAARDARLVEERTREASPASTSIVTIEPTRLPADIWRRLDEVAALDRLPASELPILRDGVERMLVERGDEMPWRLRESIGRLCAFLPDADLAGSAT